MFLLNFACEVHIASLQKAWTQWHSDSCSRSYQLHEALKPADGLWQADQLVVAGIQYPQR